MSDIRICFVGDSFVNGTGDSEFLGWVGRVCNHAVNSGYELTCYNLGVRRNTSQDILKRWHETEARFELDVDNRFVLSFGVNDTVIENGALRVGKEKALENIRQLLKKSKAMTCIVIGPPPVADQIQNERIREYSKMLAAECESFGVIFIELFSILVKDSEYLREVGENDKAHPRSTGYKKISKIVLDHPSWWF